MAFPELLFPSSLPDFKADPHVIASEGLYSPVPRQSGSARTRRVYTTVPRTLEAALEVTATQLEDFWNWFETPLQAGANYFIARVAKVGPGAEYWKAKIVKYTVDYQQGNTHLISLTLRLFDSPSDTLPTNTTLSSESVVALLASIDSGFAWGLSSEIQVDAEASVDQGPLLSSEILLHLYTEANGPQSGVPLDSEILVALETSAAVLPSESLDSEIIVALLASFSLEIPLASEVSVALVTTHTLGVGPVAAPGDATVAAFVTFPVLPTATATIQVRSDGTIYKKVNTGAYTFHANWYSPTTPGVGSPYWIKATPTSGDPPNTGDALSAPLLLTSNRTWTMLSHAVFDGFIRVDIATDPDFLSIVSSFNCELDAEFA